MIGRRQIFGMAAGSALLAKSLQGQLAAAAVQSAANVQPLLKSLDAGLARGADGRLARLASLDLESLQDFTLGFRLMQAKTIRAASMRALDRLLVREGVDPAKPITAEQVRALVANDPAVNLAAKAWLANQQITWKTLQDHFRAYEDHYLAEMEAADKSGPGTLELAPRMTVPDYARHEIHIMPGGYVGDPFAGYISHYGTNSFYISVIGHNEQDEVHKATVARLPTPTDGKVRRILDYGCGIGQMTVALQERFPDAEVWGIDVGAPMIRYGHMRARRLGSKVNFSQRLAEDTKFPDGYFDLVTSYIVHHELPANMNLAVIEEMRRVTRSGGVYYPIDFNSGGVSSPPRAMYGRWWDHRWNHEVWSMEYHSLDFSAEIAKRGFSQVPNAQAALPGFGVRHFVRQA